MRVKIEYPGGYARLAKVTNAETGELIENVQRVDLSLDASDHSKPVAILYVYEVAFTAITEADIHTGKIPAFEPDFTEDSI